MSGKTVRPEKRDCCGCTACAGICPHDAIRMERDGEGFLFPVIDEALCTDCGLCRNVCSFREDYSRCKDAFEAPLAYGAVHRDTAVHRASRSGGVFFSLAETVLNRGGSVYGVALDQSGRAGHIRVIDPKDLPALQGSKYVQSEKGDSFDACNKDLREGLPVLFSGTPCEIAGLNAYLAARHTDTSGLCTCDMICHGVPSPLIWEENLAEVTKKLGGAPESISFRDKSFGWHTHIESYTRGKTLLKNVYTTLFYEGSILRQSCANCRFANTKHPADITLGDGWGLGRAIPELAGRNGVSLILINSEKGKEMLEAVREKLDCFTADLRDCRNPNLYAPTPVSPQRDAFWELYRKKGYRALRSRYYDWKSRLKLPYNILRRRFGHPI